MGRTPTTNEKERTRWRHWLDGSREKKPPPGKRDNPAATRRGIVPNYH